MNNPTITIRHSQSSGFTMMELMFAIGILGVGMIMAATIFPVAIKESNTSLDRTLGTVICKNGLAVTKAAFAGSSPADGVWFDEENTGELGLRSQHYLGVVDDDLGEGEYLQGFVVIGKEISTNDYLLAVISYSRLKGETVTAELVRVDQENEPTNTITVSSEADQLRTGSPIFFMEDETYAYIIQVNGGEAVLDREVTISSSQASDDAYVVVQSDTSAGDDSPALSILTCRTSLEAN